MGKNIDGIGVSGHRLVKMMPTGRELMTYTVLRVLEFPIRETIIASNKQPDIRINSVIKFSSSAFN